MSKEILLGDEAVALGAVQAGLSGAYSYPGTPASEIMEYLIRVADGGRAFHAAWSVNEKTAFEEALGCSFAGRRAFVSFKHVGLNVAAAPFMSAALTGAQSYIGAIDRLWESVAGRKMYITGGVGSPVNPIAIK